MKFGKYTLLDRISHGGMAEVFRAKTFGAAGFERIVAIKLLLPNVAMDQDFVTMLIDEAKIAGQLSHANIAQIFDLGMTDGRYYIVQEYVTGLDLRKILRRVARSGRKLSVAQAIHIVIKACEGLEYAHNRRDPAGSPLNLVHRDVSPQNILISGEGEVKLIDFGIAKAEGRATRTLAGLIKGKFAYMSPEQIRGLPVDRRSDVFATGIVLHELLTNKPLFKRKSEFETLKRARSGVIDPPSKLNPDVPPELDAVVLGALARHVEDRYASSLELRDALWQFSRTSGNFYTRNELAAWMADEIAEEEVTNTGKADSGEFPLIEIAGPEKDSHPTVVDLSGQDRDSAALSGEVRQASEPPMSLEEGLDQPSVEISSDALAFSELHVAVDVAEERPTLLYEPDSPEGKSLSERLTAAIDSAEEPAKHRATLLAMSAPQPTAGPRNPAAPSYAPPVAAPPGPAALAPPSSVPSGSGSLEGQRPGQSYGSLPPVGVGQAGVGGHAGPGGHTGPGPSRPLGDGHAGPPPSRPPGAGQAGPGPSRPPGAGQAGEMVRPHPGGPQGFAANPPQGVSSTGPTRPPLANRPMQVPEASKPEPRSKRKKLVLVILAVLVLAGAIAATITLSATS